MAEQAPIVVGIGGWTFAPWRGSFFPAGLPHAQELAYASRALTAIEVNGTFYRTQSPQSFRRWAEETPDGFVLSLKAPRAATQRRDLAEGAASVTRFLESGIVELGDKLGPLLWQLPPNRSFDAAAVAGFLGLLPPAQDGVALRHALEAQHSSFASAEAVALLRQHGVARVLVETPDETPSGDLTAPFVYARLKANALDAPEGYDSAALDRWHARFTAWGRGSVETDLPLAAPAPPAGTPRPCFVFFIAGDKLRAPDAARAMLRRLA